MVRVDFNGYLYRGEAKKKTSRCITAAGWGIMPYNIARIVPDNWSIPND